MPGAITLSKRRDGLALDYETARLRDTSALIPCGILIELYPLGRRQRGRRQFFRIVAALDLILAVPVML